MQQLEPVSAQELMELRRYPLFEGVSPEALACLYGCRDVGRRRYAKGAVIYDPEHFERRLCLILSGQVQVDKGEGMVMSRFKAGDIFGAASLFQNRGRYTTRITALEEVQVLMLGQSALRKLMQQDFRMVDNYLLYLSGRIHYLSRRIDSLAAPTVEERLLTFLADYRDDAGWVRLPCRISALPAMLGMGRASLYRALETLQARGAVAREGRQIRLIQPEEKEGLDR